MIAPRIDLEMVALELGITPEQVATAICEAIHAGLLRPAGIEGDHLVLEAITPQPKNGTNS